MGMITVIGSTGSTGVPLVAELARAGERVRATSRSPERLRAALEGAGVDPSRVDVLACDLERPDTWGPVLDGAPICYVAVGGPSGTPALVDVECRFIDEARRRGVAHYVKVSGLDARPDSPSRIQRWHGEIVARLTASGLAHTILEPSFFLQNFLGLAPAIRDGVLPLPTGDARAGYIDARDIARSASAILRRASAHDGKRYLLTGPELLSHEDAARELSSVLARPVRFVDVPEEAFAGSLASAGLPRWFAELLADVYGQFFRTGGAARVTDDVQRLTGVAPCTPSAFLREHRGAFLAA